MKAILILLSLFLTFNALSQEQTERKEIKNNFKINIIPIFNGVFELQYESVLNSKSSIQFGLGFGGKNVTDTRDFQELYLENFSSTLNNPKNTEYSEKTFSINFDYRYYFTKEGMPKGMYFSPSLQYISYKEIFSAREQESFGNGSGGFDFNTIYFRRNIKLYNLRALIGYQFVLLKTIMINPYFGPSLAIGEATDFFGRKDKDAKGFGLNVGLYVGIGF